MVGATLFGPVSIFDVFSFAGILIFHCKFFIAVPDASVGTAFGREFHYYYQESAVQGTERVRTTYFDRKFRTMQGEVSINN